MSTTPPHLSLTIARYLVLEAIWGTGGGSGAGAVTTGD
ncbi:MAG: hypothetical protein QOG20_3281 [Pseudonocardiales bacterium]|jgi:hypothetical protein|nr:hypothetical protein [Pseudonocardiales bacterium]